MGNAKLTVKNNSEKDLVLCINYRKTENPVHNTAELNEVVITVIDELDSNAIGINPGGLITIDLLDLRLLEQGILMHPTHLAEMKRREGN
jgi:hypothetical protein